MQISVLVFVIWLDLGLGQNVLQRQYQSCLFLVHARLEAALVECLTQGPGCSTTASPGYGRGSSLYDM